MRTGLPSFIVTLSSLFVLRGLTIGGARAATGRTQVGGLKALAADDPLATLLSGDLAAGGFAWLADHGWIAQRLDGAPAVPGVPISLAWWLALGAAGSWLLLRTRFGNWIFAVGGDALAARNLGVPVARVKIALFTATALGAALVAAIQVLDAGSADANRGVLKEFEAITAAVMGGCVLRGGYGSVVGAMFGALLFGTVQMGIFYTGVDTDWFKVFLGAMLLIAVLVNRWVRLRGLEAAQ